MAEPTIDIKVSITPDSEVMIVEDDTLGWGTPDAADITAVEVNIYTDVLKTDLVVQITDNIVTGAAVELIIATDTLLGTEQLADGVYYYDMTYTYATGTLTKEDGIFYNTRVVEGNINDDLLDFIIGAQAYNYKAKFPKLEEIRRRDNILFAVESAEYKSETQNVENLLSLIQRLE